jgi:pullulanase
MRALAYSKGTRLEELVVMNQAGFSDLDEISSWALKSVTLASTSGLLHGNPDGRFKPQGMLTRAEAIAVLVRLMEILQR